KSSSPDAAHTEHHLSVLHAIEHLERLVERMREWPAAAAQGSVFREIAAEVPSVFKQAELWLHDPSADPGDLVERCHELSQAVAEARRAQREDNLRAAAAGRMDADLVLRRLDAMRWMDSAVYHVWRVVHHTATREAGR